MSLSISVNGASVGGLLQANITTTNYFSADSFSLTFVRGHPLLESIVSWSEASSPYVEVGYSEQGSSISRDIISGTIDSLIFDPIMRTISIEGRDLSARLVDSYLQRDFVNQTASEIIQTIADDHGLIAIATPTIGNVGRYFEDGYTKLSLGQFSKMRSNWDLVVQLAREQNFDVFVQGETLMFQPVADASNVAMEISPGSVMGMRLESTMAIPPSATITVQSWNSQQMVSYSPTTSDVGADSSISNSSANPQSYLFSRSNLTSSQADQTVQQYAKEIVRLRTVLHVEMRWNLGISARSVILLQGTNSSFDGLYEIDSLERRYSSATGSSQTFRAVSWPVVS